jgi:hypothetical protein
MRQKEERYKNLAGNSGVVSYKIGDDYIEVTFLDHKKYRYSYKVAGEEKVEEMKRLARSGRGLSSFISRFVRNLYD